MSKPSKPAFAILLQAEPRFEAHPDPGAIRRLRAALKTLLRAYGLRSLGVLSLGPDEQAEGEAGDIESLE